MRVDVLFDVASVIAPRSCALRRARRRAMRSLRRFCQRGSSGMYLCLRCMMRSLMPAAHCAPGADPQTRQQDPSASSKPPCSRNRESSINPFCYPLLQRNPLGRVKPLQVVWGGGAEEFGYSIDGLFAVASPDPRPEKFFALLEFCRPSPRGGWKTSPPQSPSTSVSALRQ